MKKQIVIQFVKGPGVEEEEDGADEPISPQEVMEREKEREREREREREDGADEPISPQEVTL